MEIVPPMKEQIIRSIGLVVSAAVLGGYLLWFFTPNPKPEDAGEWKPTGDGKTIVNSKTGELRLTRNGMNVEDAEDLADRHARLREIAAEQGRKKAEAERLASEANAHEEAARQVELRAHANAVDAKIHARNRIVYLKVRAFIESQNANSFPSTIPYFNESWHRYTAAILASQPINSTTLHSLKTLILEIQTYERIRIDKLQQGAKEAGVSLPVFAVYRGQSVEKACESAEWAAFLSVLDEAEFTESVRSINWPGFVSETLTPIATGTD